MEGLNKLNIIADLIRGKQGYIIVELHWGDKRWYVECWIENKSKVIHNGYTEDLDKTLDEIIEKLGGNT